MTTEPDPTRRDLIRAAGRFAAVGAAVGAAGMPAAAQAAPPPGALDVREAGAAGDGATDDTAAFQRAMDAAGRQGGGLVHVPRGDYLFRGTLQIPEHVTLEGIFRAPIARGHGHGSTLLTTWGADSPDATPFITMRRDSALCGLAILHPEQTKENPPVAYPWTVRGAGDNCAIVNVLMVNPYQAVDFGTLPAGRHFISGLYAGAIYRGIFVDQCYDVGRIENVHLWPFFEEWQTPLRIFTEDRGIGFVLGRTDWEYMTNCFCIGYRIGFHFVRTKAGSPNVLLTQSGSDVGPTAVRVESAMENAGVAFSNSQIMAGVEIEATNRGPVKFTSCGFWPVRSTSSQIVIAGRGHVTLTACQFAGWGKRVEDAPAIVAASGGLTVTGCDFMEPQKPQIEIGRDVEAAIVMGNRLRGARRIAVHAPGDRVEIAHNVVTPA